MKLSPLRKEVQSLNKDLQSQNIQLKDLIKFLNKSTPKQALNKQKSPKSNIKRLLQLKDCFSEDKVYKADDDKKPNIKEFRESKSMKHLKPFQPIKNQHEQSMKQLTTREIPMTKSVTFHNMQNALTTRKYLKLSRPEKKTNSSCSFCRESTFGSNIVTTDCSKFHKASSRTELESKLSKSKHLTEESHQGSNRTKRDTDSKSRQKMKQKLDSGKKAPLTQLGSNQILSKNEVKSFFGRKSNKMKNYLSKSKAKLEIKDTKPCKNKFLTKR